MRHCLKATIATTADIQVIDGLWHLARVATVVASIPVPEKYFLNIN